MTRHGTTSFALGLIVAVAVTTGASVTAIDKAGDNGPACFEDQVAAWQGTTGAHTICVDADDPRLRDAIARAGRR